MSISIWPRPCECEFHLNFFIPRPSDASGVHQCDHFTCNISTTNPPFLVTTTTDPSWSMNSVTQAMLVPRLFTKCIDHSWNVFTMKKSVFIPSLGACLINQPDRQVAHVNSALLGDTARAILSALFTSLHHNQFCDHVRRCIHIHARCRPAMFTFMNIAPLAGEAYNLAHQPFDHYCISLRASSPVFHFQE